MRLFQVNLQLQSVWSWINETIVNISLESELRIYALKTREKMSEFTFLKKNPPPRNKNFLKNFYGWITSMEF